MPNPNNNNTRQIDFADQEKLLCDCVNKLLTYQQQGEHVSINFFGHILYSDNITIDSAYKEVFGKTQAELKHERELREQAEQDKKIAEAKAKIPSWIEQGNNYIYPERAQDWEEYVKAAPTQLYHGMEIDCTLKIMEALENGDMEKAKKIFQDEGNCNISTRNLVFNFCKQGPEFWKATATKKLSPKTKQILNEKIAENKKYEQAALDRKNNTQSHTADSSTRQYKEQQILQLSEQKHGIIQRIQGISKKIFSSKTEEQKLKKSQQDKDTNAKDLNEK